MWTLKYLHEFCDDDDHLVLCLIICQVLSLGTSQKPSEIVQLREFNKELVTKVLDGPESLTGERGEAHWEAIAESLYLPPLGFGETNRGIESTDPWSHLPQMVLEWESQRRGSHCGRSFLIQRKRQIPGLLFFCLCSYFIFLSFIILILFWHGQMSLRNEAGRNQLPSIPTE